MDLQGSVAVVTGGASGIGAAVVAALGERGARTVVWDVQEGADVRCDVSDAGAVSEAMATSVAMAGPPDVMVACAGVGSFMPVLSMTPEEWDRVLGINLRGVMLSIQAAANEMVKAGRGGSVVAISSVSGTLVDRGLSAYCCSKAAVDMLVKVAAAELAPHGIKVNAVGPGVTDTPLLARGDVPGFFDGVTERTVMGRLGVPGDIAEAVLALLGCDWVTGTTLFADGGLALHSPINAWGIRAPG